MSNRFPTQSVIVTLIAASLGISGNSAFAQTPEVVFQGNVSHQNGTPIEGVQVVVRNEETGVVRVVSTSPQGKFFAFGLVPGTYEVSALRGSYHKQILKAIRVSAGEVVEVGITITPRDSDIEQASIASDRSIIRIKQNPLSTLVIPEQVERLPVNSRNWIELAKIAPGVRTESAGDGLIFRLRGGPRGVYIDGSDYKDFVFGESVGGGNSIPLDALREVLVITNLFKAGYGNSSSYIIQGITRSGTNEFHGSAYTVYRGKALNARGAFETERPSFSRYQRGISVGGPIVRDRLHFFAAYENWDLQTVQTVFTTSPIFQQRYPDQIGTFTKPYVLNEGVVRLDWQINNSQSLIARWIGREDELKATGFGPSETTRNINGYMRAYNVLTRVNDYLITHTTFFTPQLMNETKFQAQRATNEKRNVFEEKPGLLYPSFAVGQPIFIPQLTRSTRYALGDDISYFVPEWGGEHAFKAGIRADYAKLYVNVPRNFMGVFVFRSDTSTIPRFGRIGIGKPDVSTSNTRLGVYVQDDWTIIKDVMLSLGLRWDYQSNIVGNDFATPEKLASDPVLQQIKNLGYLNNGRNERPPYTKAFSPRVGFSWDVLGNKTTSIHGGWGVFHDQTTWAWDEQSSTQWQLYTVFFAGGGSGGTTAWDPRFAEDAEVFRGFVTQSIANGTLPADARDLNLYPRDFPPPVNKQIAIGITHALTLDIAVEFNYVRQRSSREPVTENLNWRRASTGQRVLSNNYGDILAWKAIGSKKSDALQLTLRKVYRNGWQINFNYVLSWAKANFDDKTVPQPFIVNAITPYAPQTEDERHSVRLTALVDLPLDVQLSGRISLATARSYDITTGTDDNDNGNDVDDFPAEGRNSARQELQPFLWKHLFANRNVDLRLAKVFHFGGTFPIRLILIVEAFNLFNWVNYNSFSGNPNSATFGRPTSASDPRQIQIGVRVSY